MESGDAATLEYRRVVSPPEVETVFFQAPFKSLVVTSLLATYPGHAKADTHLTSRCDLSLTSSAPLSTMDSLVHLRLDVTEDSDIMRRSFNSAIQYTHRPNVVFSRVDPKVAKPSPLTLPTPNDIIYRLVCTSYLRFNELFDVYRATIKSDDPRDPLHDRNVMLKFMGTNNFGEAGTEFETPESALDAVYNEAELYETRLSKIEGAVPACYGLFALTTEIHTRYHEDVLVMVLEDFSEPPSYGKADPYTIYGVKPDIA